MPKSSKYLLMGSPEAYSGKSAIVLGIAHQLREKGLDIAYGKPIGTYLGNGEAGNTKDADVLFIAQSLALPDDRIFPMLLPLDQQTVANRISGADSTDYLQMLQHCTQRAAGDLVLLEGAGTLEEGTLFNLSLPQLAQALSAAVVLVTRFRSDLVVEPLLVAKQRLGESLAGVLINDVPPNQVAAIEAGVKPFLEAHGIDVLGVLPRNNLLRSVSVRELAHQLNAEVLCRADRLDLMVESLKIGAMSVNSALGYFRKGRNMAVVTGGDRTDIQLAAMETSTHCLILTGHMPPSPTILSRAEDLEIPILTVDLDTLTAVEIVNQTFGQVRLHEPIKVQTICQMMSNHFAIDRLLAKLGLEPAVTA